jgi:hypothetical protein
MSEGDFRDSFWFGTTSIVLQIDPDSSASKGKLLGIASGCIHLRTRALRLARREAILRAGRSLGASQCEFRVSDHARGLRIDIDVQAVLLRSRRAAL